MLKEYKSKLLTSSEIASRVNSGDKVFVGTASSFAYELLDALWERRNELKNVEILCSQSIKPVKMFCEAEDNPFNIATYFMGAGERRAKNLGISVNYTSSHLSQLDYWAHEVRRPDICFLEVSRPDENGDMSFGPSGCCHFEAFIEMAREIYVEANVQTPYVSGNRSFINVKDVDGIVEIDSPLAEIPDEKPDEITSKISDIILEEIPDGATIQLGIGKLSTAVGYGLMQKNDLGIHTELLSEPMMHLIKNGNVTNKNKGFMDGLSVFGFALGTNELYKFMDNNQKLYSGSFSFINDARIIARNRRMMSINSAMSVDLYGQVAADSMGYYQQSAVGGQLDYVKGSQWSEGGKSFIALSSSYVKNGELKSKISLSLPIGTAVTTPRSEVQYIATEYGCINLKPLTMADRVRAMISLAHPVFRDELTEQAKYYGMI